MQNPLGRLVKVSLREVWTSEASAFTPWLAREENLSLLGDTIGIELECEAQEQAVGPFRADILCKDTASEDWVLIENQLERTDHSHLGQILTYAAGLGAVTIVWIAERFTDEHRAALDWLNERTDEKINLFGLEIELWRIGDSPPAPKFNVVCKPNAWSKAVRGGAEGKVTGIRELQFRFWTGFREYMEENSRIRCQKVYPQHWMNHPIGRSGFHMTSVASTFNSESRDGGPEIRAELTMIGDEAKERFAALELRKDEIERAIGCPLTWHNPEGKKACRIYTRRDADFGDESQWPEQHRWLREKLELFHRVLGPIVQELD